MHKDWVKAEKVLKAGGVAMLPTDTLYGLLASAFDKKAVERIYKLKGRDEKKPCIVLISDIKDLKKFGIKTDNSEIFQPRVSVVLPITGDKFKYIHRGTHTIAFRLVGERTKNLHHILKTVGPLVAPSANPQGKSPAISRKTARAYFGTGVDVYVCSGNRYAQPSTLVEYRNGKVKILRQGSVILKNASSK